MSSPASQLRSFRKTKILKAGAGAGKTTTLVSLFLQYAMDFRFDHGRYPKIVVSTFTRKATQELKERLSHKALSLRESQPEAEGLFEYVTTKSLVQISTIHGVLGLFLSRFGYLVGLTPDFKIVSESDSKKQIRRLLRQILLSKNEWRDLLEELDFASFESIAAESFDAFLTYPQLRRADEQLLKNIREEKFLHFSGKLVDLSNFILTEASNEKWKEYAQAFVNLPWSQGLNSVRDAVENGALPKSKPPFKNDKPAFDIQTHEEFDEKRKLFLDFLEDRTWLDSSIQKHEAMTTIVSEIMAVFNKKYLDEKLMTGQISMRDLETLSLYILRLKPESGLHFSKDWDFWMIDEYQDTSPIQVELLNRLMGDKPAFYVGDPQQSIYLFRGARSRVFHEKVDEIQAQGGVFEEAKNNYRSHREVLAVFNDYFTRLSSQFGTMTVPTEKSYSTLIREPLHVWLLQDEEAQQLAVIQRVQELIADGVSPETICILGRTNSDLEALARKAQEYGLSIQLHAGGSFFERREVQDILHFIKVLLNPHDNAAFLSLLRSPWFFVSDSEIAQFCHKYDSSFFAKASQLTKQNSKHPVQELIQFQERAERVGVLQTVQEYITQKGLIDYSMRLDSTGRREANIWKLLTLLSQEERRPGFNFLDFVDERTGSRDPDIADEDGDATPVIEPKRVNLMTVHASKGLQFEHVLVPWMEKPSRAFTAPLFMIDEGTGIWTMKVRDSEVQDWITSGLMDRLVEQRRSEEEKESQRVLYVAFTRAISGVHLFWVDGSRTGPWAKQCPLLLADGQQEGEGYRYQVLREEPQPVKQENSLWKVLPVRSPYIDSLQAVKSESSSVTAMLEQQMKSASASASSRPKNILNSLKRAQSGTDAHRLFEGLKYADFAEVYSLAPENQKMALDYIYQGAELPLFDFIKAGHVEWGFALRTEFGFYQGQIDLWVDKGDQIYIVDYKTGSQHYSEQAFHQLEFYAWCLGRMNLIHSQIINLVVVYPFDQELKVRTFNDLMQLNLKVEDFIRSSVAEPRT